MALALGLALGNACAPVAAAQAPSFHGYSAAVALPGGDSGQLRRLYGAGPDNSDFVRLVITDKSGGVRALGPVGYAIEFSCSASQCSVYVYRDSSLLPTVYRFDPLLTRSTDILSASADSDLGIVMRAEVAYGFAEVPGLLAGAMGAFACLMRWWPSFVALVLIGACIVPAWLCVERAIVRTGQRLRAVAAGILQAGAIVAATAAACALYLWATGYPPLLGLIAVSLPTLGLLVRLSLGHAGEGRSAATA